MTNSTNILFATWVPQSKLSIRLTGLVNASVTNDGDSCPTLFSSQPYISRWR